MKNKIKNLENRIRSLHKKLTVLKEKQYNINILNNSKKEIIMENQINIFDVAQFFVKRNQNIDERKIQNLLYYAQGYYSAKYNKVLFQENIEAWSYGITVPAIYAETLYQELQKQNFKLSSISFDFSSRMSHLPLTEEQEEILKQVFNNFNHIHTSQLDKQIRNEPPWIIAYNPNKLYSSCQITPSILYSFFKTKTQIKNKNV